MEDLKVTLIQADLRWEDPTANRGYLSRLMAQISEPTDLIVLPEMFTTGFTMNPARHAEPENSVNWLAEQAAKTGAVVTGSQAIVHGDKYYNRLFWVQPDGSYEHYDKRHLFTLAGEHEHYTAGEQRLLVQLKGWTICPLICYDLRFPVWSRNREEYDLLIYVANWPAQRAYDWQTLLRARAIENQCYVVAVNRVGTDGNGHQYRGDSCVIDPGWRKTLYSVADKEVVHTEVLLADHLQEVRRKRPFLADQGGIEYF
ncbi:MAG: amidohydrolase [Bacteroidota bacterium]